MEGRTISIDENSRDTQSYRPKLVAARLVRCSLGAKVEPKSC